MTTKKLPNIPDLSELHRWWEMKEEILSFLRMVSRGDLNNAQCVAWSSGLSQHIESFDREQPEDLTGETK